jgi:hypothetical protein
MEDLSASAVEQQKVMPAFVEFFKESRESVMSVRKRDVTSSLRNQMFQRIDQRRSQLIMERRNQSALSLESKRRFGNELMSEALVEDLNERPPDMTVEEWNDIYIQVTRELHEAIAK